MEPVTPYKDTELSKKAQIEQMFDNIAPRYDFLNHLLSMGIDKLWRRRVIKELRSGNPERILDVATGTGDLAMACVKLSPGKIVGIDISENMLALARKKVAKARLEGIIELQKADSEELPFEDNTFDAVTVAFGVRNFENLKKGLSEMFRVLKPGGALAVLEFSKPARFPVKQLFYLYFHYVCPVIGKFFSKDKSAYDYLPESVQKFPEGEAFEGILKQTGFNLTLCRSLTFGIASLYTARKP